MADLRFGPGGIPRPARDGGIMKAIQYCKDNDLRCMEMEFVHSTWLKEEQAAEVKKAAEEANVALTAHGSYYINLNAKEEKTRVASRNRILSAAYRTWQAGGRSVTFHAAFYLQQDPEEVYQQVKKEMSIILDELKKNNVNILLSPETTGKPTQFGTYQEICRLANELEGVGICIDFAHLHARSNGAYNTYEEFCEVLEHVKKTLGQKRVEELHIHLSGIEYGPKGEKYHLECQESDMNWNDLFRAFKKYAVGGYAISESPIIEEDAIWMKQQYEKK
jgi:deoxyribonuclease IV